MHFAKIMLLLAAMAVALPAQTGAEGPKDEKAQKSYREAQEYLKKHMFEYALDQFKKADKQDGGRCLACQKYMVKYGLELRDWKTAQAAAGEMIAEAQTDQEKAIGHYQLGVVLFREGLEKHKDELFNRAHDEFVQSLAASPNLSEALFADGRALAQLKQDDTAKERFEQFVKLRPEGDVQRQRALRYVSQPELARARMAPPFTITTIDGQRLTLDDLKGKVVLLDFWATWCGPCREALPHMLSIAKNFQGQPLVIVSVSLDSDEKKWKDYIAKNGMSWIHYRDGGFTGPIARMFNVEAIPHTFTIDADGVLQDEKIGDASIEGKLKKLVAQAREVQVAEKPAQ